MTTDELPEVLTTDQAADLLQTSTKTLREKVIAGEIPALRLGRQYRFHRSVLLNMTQGYEPQVRVALTTRRKR